MHPNEFDIRAMTVALQRMRSDPTADPRDLHDALRGVAAAFDARRKPVPPDLRRALEDLEADIAEAYFNNLPV